MYSSNYSPIIKKRRQTKHTNRTDTCPIPFPFIVYHYLILPATFFKRLIVTSCFTRGSTLSVLR